MNETILITGNAGQGKTTIAANLATALARFGIPTFLGNADETTSKLHYHFGIQIPNGKTYSHTSGLQIKFTNAQPQEQMMNIIDVPTYNQKWYNTGYPTIIVTKPDFPSVIEAFKLTKHISNVKGIIINQAEHDNYELSPGNINHFTSKTIIGVVPQDKAMREAIKLGHPLTDLYPHSKTTTIIKKIAANLINQQYQTRE